MSTSKCHGISVLLWSVMLLAAGLPARAAEPPRLWAFDFQPADGRLMVGFTAVTPTSDYTAEKGFGFTGSGGIGGGDGQIPDDLTRDSLRTGRPFRVDLPNGEYEARVYSSDFITPPSSTWTITANGQKAFEEAVSHDSYYARYYRFEKDDAEPGQSIWEKYVAPMTAPKVFRSTVTQGRLELVVQNHPWNGLVIVPADPAAQPQAAAGVEAARRAQFEKDFYHEAPHEEKAPAPRPTRVDEQRGFILFAKPYLERVYPNTNPRPWNVKSEVACFASPGEFEPVAFSIYPLRDLGEVSVRVSDLVGPEGARIPPGNCDLRVVKNMEERAGTHLMEGYTVAPQLLIKQDPFVVKRGLDRTWWLTVRVPADAKPGVYAAEIKLSVGVKDAATLGYRLRVLPIALSYPPDRKHLTGAYPPRMVQLFPEQADNKEYYAHVEAELRDIRNHGFEEYSYYATWIPTPTLKIEDGKLVDADFIGAKEMVEIYRRVGMTVPPISFRFEAFSRLKGASSKTTGQGYYARSEMSFSPEFRENVVAALTLLRDKARAEGLPPIEITVPDEPHGDRLPEALEMAKIVRSVPGVMTSSSGMIEDDCEKIGPYLDRWGTYRTPPSVCALGRKLGALVMRDHGGALRNPGATRFENGFYFWKAGIPAIRWWYSIERGEPYSVVDGVADWEGSFIYTTPEGPPNPTLDWEAAREGVDDVKYVYTLTKLIEQARAGTNAAAKTVAQDAATILDGILKPINDDFGTYGSEGAYWSPEVYDKYRWRVAQAIMALQDALAGRKVGRLLPDATTARAPWLDQGFAWRLPITVSPGPYEREDCVVQVGGAAARAGRLVEYGGERKDEVGVPALLAPTGAPTGLFWMLAGHTPAEEPRRFFLYYPVPAGAPSGPRASVALQEGADRLSRDPNLAPNPGFEVADPADAARAAAWAVSLKQNVEATAVRETAGGCSAGSPCCMRLTFKKASDVMLISDPIPLKPNTDYVYAVWNRIAEGSGYENLWSGVDFYTADNKSIQPRLRVSRQSADGDWHATRRRFRTPPGTSYGKIAVGAGVFAGSILFDGVSLEEYSLDRRLPPAVTVGPAEARGR